jgi:hypothetical protein
MLRWTRRPLGFEVGDVTCRVACGKLADPSLTRFDDPDKLFGLAEEIRLMFVAAHRTCGIPPDTSTADGLMTKGVDDGSVVQPAPIKRRPRDRNCGRDVERDGRGP